MNDEDDERIVRGRALEARVKDANVRVTELHREADVSRQTAYSAFKGDTPLETIAALEAAFERIVTDRREHPDDYAVSNEDDLAEVELHGVFGVSRVIVRSRAGHLKEEIIATIQALREVSGPEK